MVSTEIQEQQALFEWAEFAKQRHPELSLLFHIGNERKCSPQRGRQLKMAGIKPGVPDICLPVQRGKYGALWIELKRRKGGTVSENQRAWLEKLNENGHKAVVCKGWDEARQVLEEYLASGTTKTA